MKLGSLFDGIGGFPLAGMMHGIEPVWASEIEPFPIAVTKKRFPNMKHLGSVTDINGAEIEPVDVITFGSPCQDLSVAGLQKGIHEGSRSNLFFEAIRIIKEMRSATNGQYPRFAVWENVPGAFSSNKGSDFQAVLQAFCEISDAEAHVPFPEKGKWYPAGCIVGDGYSVAWRVYDAQYWGVPQRRKRIYLVAYFASERAGEILFECEGLRRDSETSGEAWEGIAEDAEGCAGGSRGVVCLNPWDSQTIRQYDANGIFPALCCNSGGGQNRAGIVCSFVGGQGAKAGSVAYSEDVAPTLRLEPSGTNTVPDVIYPTIARTLVAEHDASPCVDRGQNVIALDCRNMSENIEVSGTPQAKNQGGHSLNYINPIVYDQQRIGQYGQTGTASTLVARLYKSAADVVVEKDRKYIVRRLTPLECCRLQGFPDGWTEDLAIENPTDEQIDFFTEVWALWAAINGTKPKSRNQVIKWLKDPQSDSAEYKAYGNSLAIPCAADVIGRVAKALRSDSL